ncbi:MAG: class I SAM-dependent methyltransferase [Thermoprotei archaeon]|nr:class I SAM-dependent methyltransferase [Thermoprotei archaeon]
MGERPIWETGIPPWLYSRLFVSWRRVNREVEVLERVFKKFGAKRLVEFGCGVGRHGYLMSKRGFEVLLTDAVDWRFGAARKLPFREYDVLRGGDIGFFDGGYAMGLIIILTYRDMVKALGNIKRLIVEGGPFVFDYNFTTYNEPREVNVKVRGRNYRALLKRDTVEPVAGGVIYKYRIEVVDNEGNIVGVEDAAYPVYNKEVIMNAIRDSSWDTETIIWAKWNPTKYLYTLSKHESDSAFIVLRKP